MRHLFYIAFIVYLFLSSCKCGKKSHEQVSAFLNETKSTKIEQFLQKVDFENLDSVQKIEYTILNLKNIDFVGETIPDFSNSYPDFESKNKIQRCASIDDRSSDTQRFFEPTTSRIGRSLLDNMNAIVPVRFIVYEKKSYNEDLQNKIFKSIELQLNTLNDVYEKFGIKFENEEKDNIINYKSANHRVLITDDKFNEIVSKSVLPEKYLNIFVSELYTETGSEILGISSFPKEVNDGIILNPVTLIGYPGVSVYGEGKTLVHEVGHYFGLYHTFNMNSELCPLKKCNTCDDKIYYNGCDYFKKLNGKVINGDFISDTPSQKFCNKSFCTHTNEVINCDGNDICDSCPQEPGVDNINNFMDYVPDLCMNNFTEGQIEWMKKNILQYRTNFVRWNDLANNTYDEIKSSYMAFLNE